MAAGIGYASYDAPMRYEQLPDAPLKMAVHEHMHAHAHTHTYCTHTHTHTSIETHSVNNVL